MGSLPKHQGNIPTTLYPLIVQQVSVVFGCKTRIGHPIFIENYRLG